MLGCFALYVFLYYPREAEPFEIDAVEPTQRILIATQSSEFKNTLVRTLCDSLTLSSARVRGIDVGGLKKVNDDDWDKIIIISSFIIRLNRNVERFLNRSGSPEKILLLVTSGGADWKPQPGLMVDAITSSSKQSHIQDLANMITDWGGKEDDRQWMPGDYLLALRYYSQVEVDSACEAIASERERYMASYPNLINMINRIGYEFLRWGKVDSALQIFELNVNLFPNHWNVYDSYGEALLMNGDKDGAISNYRRALELNPESRSAKEKLKELRND